MKQEQQQLLRRCEERNEGDVQRVSEPADRRTHVGRVILFLLTIQVHVAGTLRTLAFGVSPKGASGSTRTTTGHVRKIDLFGTGY